MKSTSSGNGLRKRARHRLDAAIGNQSPADLGFDHLAEHFEAAVEVFACETLVECAFADLAIVLRLLHHLADEAVGVELTQRAVEVVRAANRSARFHAGEAARLLPPRASSFRSGPCA